MTFSSTPLHGYAGTPLPQRELFPDYFEASAGFQRAWPSVLAEAAQEISHKWSEALHTNSPVPGTASEFLDLLQRALVVGALGMLEVFDPQQAPHDIVLTIHSFATTPQGRFKAKASKVVFRTWLNPTPAAAAMDDSDTATETGSVFDASPGLRRLLVARWLRLTAGPARPPLAMSLASLRAFGLTASLSSAGAGTHTPRSLRPMSMDPGHHAHRHLIFSLATLSSAATSYGSEHDVLPRRVQDVNAAAIEVHWWFDQREMLVLTPELGPMWLGFADWLHGDVHREYTVHKIHSLHQRHPQCRDYHLARLDVRDFLQHPGVPEGMMVDLSEPQLLGLNVLLRIAMLGDLLVRMAPVVPLGGPGGVAAVPAMRKKHQGFYGRMDSFDSSHGLHDPRTAEFGVVVLNVIMGYPALYRLVQQAVQQHVQGGGLWGERRRVVSSYGAPQTPPMKAAAGVRAAGRHREPAAGGTSGEWDFEATLLDRDAAMGERVSVVSQGVHSTADELSDPEFGVLDFAAVTAAALQAVASPDGSPLQQRVEEPEAVLSGALLRELKMPLPVLSPPPPLRLLLEPLFEEVSRQPSPGFLFTELIRADLVAEQRLPVDLEAPRACEVPRGPLPAHVRLPQARRSDKAPAPEPAPQQRQLSRRFRYSFGLAGLRKAEYRGLRGGSLRTPSVCF